MPPYARCQYWISSIGHYFSIQIVINHNHDPDSSEIPHNTITINISSSGINRLPASAEPEVFCASSIGQSAKHGVRSFPSEQGAALAAS